MSETILQEAQRLVYGDRQASYGNPFDDFSKTAALWTVVLGDILQSGTKVTPEQVAMCMVQVKVSRQLHGPKRDNLVDGAGYFATLELVIEERRRRAQLVASTPANEDPE